ncbi:MAG: DUF4738 domain-containing protein [Chitinophagaceae bacterium]
MNKFLLLFLIVLISCGQNPEKKDELSAKSNEVIEGHSFQAIRQRYTQTYDKPIEFSGLDEGKKGEEIKVWGKYYCLFDKGIDVPKKYIQEDEKKDFITHNFAADLVIISNNDTILKKTITKRDFKGHLSSELSDYGVFSEPVFCGYDEKNDAFTFHFTISIPVTNIAVSKMLFVKRDGELIINE